MEELRDVDDVEKAKLAAAGDLRAFDTLIMRYQGMVTGLLFRFTAQRADLEDLVQETFIRAFKSLNRWEARKPFSHWLKRIAVNVGRDYCRRKRSAAAWIAESTLDDAEALGAQAAHSGDSTAADYTLEAQWLLAKLNPDDRTLLTLHYLNGMRFHEIAEHLGWSISKTKVRSMRAKRKLQRIMETHGYKRF